MYVHRYSPADPRLGRHVRHDPRSHAYGIAGLPRSAYKSVAWQRRVPIFDQGQVGSCTFNAGAGLIATDCLALTGRSQVTVKADSHHVFTAGAYAVDEPFALRGYSLTTLDDSYPGSYPPDDTGSDALGVMAAFRELGLATVYNHAFSLDATRAALQKGPVMWGTVWLNSMFETDANGFLVVDPTSGVAGGHELVLNGMTVGTTPDADIFGGDNSWGSGWGVGGTFLVRAKDLDYLLGQSGDICQPTWSTAPAPGPAVDDKAFWTYAKAWGAGHGFK